MEIKCNCGKELQLSEVLVEGEIYNCEEILLIIEGLVTTDRLIIERLENIEKRLRKIEQLE